MEMGVYSKIDEIDATNKYLFAKEVLFNALDLYCPSCKENKTFVFKTRSDSQLLGFFQLTTSSPITNRLQNLTYTCPTCGQVLYFSFHFFKDTVMKIAQIPSLYDVSRDELKKYQKNNIIDKDSFAEIYKADICASESYYVAAYTYMRRVFENLIKNVFEQNKDSIGITFEEFCKLRMEDKIKIIKPYLAIEEDIYKPLYALLSEGMHISSEEECQENYQLLKAIILDILVEERAKKEKKANRAGILDLISKRGK